MVFNKILLHLIILLVFDFCTKKITVKPDLLQESGKVQSITEIEVESLIFKRIKTEKGVQYALFSKVYNKNIWESLPSQSFVVFAKGNEKVEESRGSFFIQDNLEIVCSKQFIESIEKEKNFIYLRGYNECENQQRASYAVFIYHMGKGEIGIDIKNYDQTINRTYFYFRTDKEENFFGFGEQFTFFNLKGKKVPLFVSEQGIGRGEEPITTGANLTAKAGGNWSTTYAPVPYFITNKNRAFFLMNSQYSEFDLEDPESAFIMIFSSELKGKFITGNSPQQITELYTQYSGRMVPLPDWVHRGAIIGMQGGTGEVYEKWEMLKKYNTPISAFWLQDWVGQRITSFGKQLWWNWELDEDRYPDWKKLVQDLNKENIQVMLYISPFIADIANLKSNIKQNLFEEARNQGYLVKKVNGEPYLVKNTDFYAAMIDLTNPEARNWYKSIIKKNLMSIGAKGWMADFGEALPYDAVLSQGNPKEFHNLYPEEWARLNYEVLIENDKQLVYFLRAGFTRSPRFATLFWLGDQLVSWSEYDGIKTAVTGLISSGLCGYVYNHSDIGGYTTITHWLKNYHRSKELFLRWSELNAFTAIYRTHEGNQPENNHQFYSDEETLKFFSRFAKIYAHLFPYRKDLIQEASEKGFPLVRPLFFHYPDDENVYNIHYEQFLLGEDLLVAPILDQGHLRKEVYLPEGKWIHLWSQQPYDGNKKIKIDAPLGNIPVFYKSDSRYRNLFETIKEIE